jgi:uncharacterized coiled-coil DUF342 family protein
MSATGDHPQQQSPPCEAQEDLRRKVSDLQEEVGQLRTTEKELREEISNYEKMLEAWEKYGVAPFTRKELDELEKHGVPFEEIVREIEELTRSSGEGA